MMDWLQQLRFRFWGLFQKRRHEADMAAEMQLHIDMQTEKNISDGIGPEEARYDALRQFGWVDSMKESGRDQQRLRWLENLLQDTRVGGRQLSKNPGFTAAITLTLGLGIGAVIAIFTAADDLLFRELPYRDPSRLVRLWESNETLPAETRSLVSADNFLEWRTRNSVFEEMAAYYDGRSVLYEADHSEELHIQGVTTNFFTMLGVHAFQGRLFSTADESADADPGLIISYRLWRSRFEADPNIVGRIVRLDSISGAIVGVAPPGFSFGDREVDMWLSLDLKATFPKSQGRDLNAVARLKPGILLPQVQMQMQTISRVLEQQEPRFDRNWSVKVEPLRDSFTRNVRGALLVLLGAVGLLLATACGNTANLILARSFSRRTEIAVRIALGASRCRLMQQLLTESMLLAFLSGIAGLVFGKLALSGLIGLAPRTLTQTADVSIDSGVVLFALGLSTLTGIIFGIAPAFLSAKIDVAPELKQSGRTGSLSSGRFRAWLIAGEIAASVVLLTGGGLLFSSLSKLQAVDPGLHPDNVLTFHFRVASPENVSLFAASIERISMLPGVRSASATSFLPFDGIPATTRVNFGGRIARKPGNEMVATVRTIVPRYFETMGIPLRRGRDFSAADSSASSPLRFIINEAFANQFLKGEEPLGKRMNTSMARIGPYGEIIGVVGDVKEGSLRQAAVPTVYYPYGHMPYGQMNLVIRTVNDPMGVLQPARDIVHSLDSSVPISDARTMGSIIEETYARERFSEILMSGFSIVALLLAATGIYGIILYSVSERTRELGIRIAVGAPTSSIVAIVLKGAAKFVVPGIIAGVVGALVVSDLLSSLLFQTATKDPAAFLVAPLMILFVALLAAFFPVLRATSVDPMTALRLE
jgi:putative ABC transport system permease protein